MSLRKPAPRNEILVGSRARLQSPLGFQIGPRDNVKVVTRMLTVLPLNKSYGSQAAFAEILGQHASVVDSTNQVIGKSPQVFIHRMLQATST